MDAVDFEMFCKAMPILEHQDILINMRTASYPNLKRDAASRLHKEVYKKAFPKELVNNKELTAAEAERVMKRFSNG